MQHDFVFGLGPACRTAWNLRSHFGVAQTYPFDWWITPTRSMLRMLEPGFAFTLAAEDLSLTPPNPKGENSVYNHRLNILHHHDFARENRLVTALPAEAIEAVARRYRRRFARLHADLAAAQAPLAVVNGIAPGWKEDPSGQGRMDPALSGAITPRELVAAVRDRLGRRLRVVVVSAGPEMTEEVEGGAILARPDLGRRHRTPGAPGYAEPVHVFRDAFAALGLAPKAA